MNILVIIANPFTHDSRVLNELTSLIRAGYEVTVLAWDFYKKTALTEKNNGINIIRIRDAGLASLLYYRILRLPFWYSEAYKKAIGLNKKKKFDVIHCHDLITLPIGIRLKKSIGCFLIYDAHEIFGYLLREAKWPLNWLANYFLWKERRIIQYVDEIITVNEYLMEYFSGITNKPITIITHCKPLQGMAYESANNNKFTIIYIRSLNKSRFILEAIEVVKELSDVCFIIGGLVGLSKYIYEIKRKISNVPNIYFIGPVPETEVLSMTKNADVVVCMFDPKDTYQRIGSPNKLFEAMVCGRPILVSRGTFVGELVNKEKCGLVVPYTKNDLKDAIVRLRDDSKLRET